LPAPPALSPVTLIARVNRFRSRSRPPPSEKAPLDMQISLYPRNKIYPPPSLSLSLSLSLSSRERRLSSPPERYLGLLRGRPRKIAPGEPVFRLSLGDREDPRRETRRKRGAARLIEERRRDERYIYEKEASYPCQAEERHKLASAHACVYAFRRPVAGNANSPRNRAQGSAAALRTALFTPALRIYVSLRDVIPGRDDKINSKRRSLQIAARASVRSSPKSLANLPSVSRAFDSLPETGRAATRGGWSGVGGEGRRGRSGRGENLFEYLG